PRAEELIQVRTQEELAQGEEPEPFRVADETHPERIVGSEREHDHIGIERQDAFGEHVCPHDRAVPRIGRVDELELCATGGLPTGIEERDEGVGGVDPPTERARVAEKRDSRVGGCRWWRSRRPEPALVDVDAEVREPIPGPTRPRERSEKRVDPDPGKLKTV